jgi:UDP-sugar transporter A1/2/3
MLRRVFSWTKWRALLLLVLGCVLVASPAFTHTAAASNDVLLVQYLSGIVAIIGLVCASGYSAVYFESILKTEKVSIWERNFQLAAYSIMLMLMLLMAQNIYAYQATGVGGSARHSVALFEQWTANATVLSFISAAGGLLVAASLKYADSVLKTLATSGSIVLSAVLGHALLGAELDVVASIGCVCTILAICNYTFEETSAAAVLPMTVATIAAIEK